MKKVSVIIPLYNNEKYIAQAIESILNQTIKNDIECIVVNDGSTDGGGEIANAFQDRGVIVVHTPNMGVSCARNTGIRMATGKWIGFLDADDYCLPNMYEIMVKEGEGHNVGIVQCNHCKDVDGVVYEYKKRANDTLVMDLRADGKEIINAYYSSVCCKIFKKEVLEKNNINFYAGCRIGEDTAFTTLALNYAAICTISDFLYVNRVRSDSTGRTKTIYEEMNALFTLQQLRIDLISRNMWDISMPRIERYIRNTRKNIEAELSNGKVINQDSDTDKLNQRINAIENKLVDIAKILS